MLFDKLSFFQKTKFKIAKKVSPVNHKNKIELHDSEFKLYAPQSVSVSQLVLKEVEISQNYCFLSSSVSISSTAILTNPEIDLNNKFTSVTFPLLPIYDLGNIEEINKKFPIIENFIVKLHKPPIRGKVYRKEITELEIKKEKITHEFQIDSNSESIPINETPVIQRQYTEKNKFDEFDVFDLIFPSLQPPLGKNFDNPIVFPRPLLAFQPEGIEFLLNNPSALLGDEMGLGKTIQTIVALKVLFSTGKISTCCVVCPKALITNWYNELIRWAPELKALKLDGGKSQRKQLWQSGAHIYICVYESLQKDLEKTIEMRGLKVDELGHHFKCPNLECNKELEVPFTLHYSDLECPHCATKFFYPYKDDRAKTYFDVLVFDEIQKTKNPKTKMTKATRTLYAKYKWALSGTPLENKMRDLVTICETISPELFKEVNIKVTQEIINTYKNIFIRRKKDDVLKDLIPIQSKYEWLELAPNQRRKYDMAEQTGIVDLEGKGQAVTIHHIFALISKLKQLCNFDPETLESSKLEYLKEKLQELTSQGDKALIFSQFPNKTLVPLLPILAEFKPLYYHGGLTTKEREEMIRKFQDPENNENKIMLLSLKSGNAGITLTRANYVFHFDLWWNPAISSQAAGRAHRIGQNKTVFETMLLAEDTIERRIFDILETKKSLFNAVVDDLSEEINLDKLISEEEIFGLFGLQKRRYKTTVITSQTATDIHLMEAESFVNFAGELFSLMGYHLKTINKDEFGEFDIHAKKITPTGIDEVVFRCVKVEGSEYLIDKNKTDEFFESMKTNKKIKKAYFVTNGKFSEELIASTQNGRFELIDGAKLIGYIQIYFPK